MKPVQKIAIQELLGDKRAAYSRIIDVRSPSEFAEDHFPGAVNYPSLDDAERAQIGTLYKQVNPFEARKLGASLMGQRVAQHISNYMLDQDKSFAPVLYCWRGGQRSNAFGMFLAQIGWTITVVEGGYKAYRTAVLEDLERLSSSLDYRVLGGPTGSGKTRLLHEIARQGGQIIDLEGLAGHRGSLLGEVPDIEPPRQKAFDSDLAEVLRNLNPAKPVFIESESAKIGRVYQPKAMWQALSQARYTNVDASVEDRVELIVNDYQHWVDTPEPLLQVIERLRQRLGGEVAQELKSMVAGRNAAGFVRSLLEAHYDPSYKSSRNRHFQPPSSTITLNPNDPTSLGRVADSLLKSQSN